MMNLLKIGLNQILSGVSANFSFYSKCWPQQFKRDVCAIQAQFKTMLFHVQYARAHTYILRLWENPKNMTGQLKRGEVAFESIFVPNCRVGPNKHVVTK